MTDLKVNQVLNVTSIADLKVEVKSCTSGPEPLYRRPTSHYSIVEWKLIETSTEDAQLERVAVNKNYYTSHGCLDEKRHGITTSSMELTKEMPCDGRNETKEMNFYTYNDGGQFSDSKRKGHLTSNDSLNLHHEGNATRALYSYQQDGTEAGSNRGNKKQASPETKSNVLDESDFWQAFKQHMKLRRRRGDFPPLLTSLSGKGCSNLPNHPACMQLRHIRSQGRFILQEFRTSPAVPFRPIRSQGRLVLQLIHRVGNVPVPQLSTKPRIRKPADAPVSQTICTARAESKAETLRSQFEQTSKDMFTNHQNKISTNLASSGSLDKDSLLPTTNLIKKMPTDIYLCSMNTAKNIKMPPKACSSKNDGKCSNNRCFHRQIRGRNSCSMPEELLQSSEFNFKRNATCLIR